MSTSSTPLFVALVVSLLAGCDEGFADPSREFGDAVAATGLHPVRIHTPPSLGVIETDRSTVQGTDIGVACETCHGDPDLPTSSGWVGDEGNPELVHGSLSVAHGALTCDACHAPEHRSRLHLADGRALAMGDAMDLCHQCHGPQTRDYVAGSHGGMSGYWDLRQGPRERNHCLDCHDAHAPAYQGGLPVAATVDRGRAPAEGSH